MEQIKFNNLTFGVKRSKILRIPISSEFFDEDETKISPVYLYYKNILVNECIIEIFKGKTHSYCILDEKGYTFGLLFNKINPKVKIPLYNDNDVIIDKFDTNDTLYRKRYTFMNFSQYSILIDDEYFSIPAFLPKIKSYQLSVYDIHKKIAIAKPLSLEQKDTFTDYYEKYASKAIHFKISLQKIIEDKKFEKISPCLEKYKELIYFEFFLNKSQKKLENIFNSPFHVIFYSNYSLYKIVDNLYDKEKLEEIVNWYESNVKKIINNQSLKYYQKILLIEFISDLCSDYNSRKEIEHSKFEYYLMNKKEKNSVLDIVENFFREYREKLHENSPIFETLIELEGGAGIFKDELFYNFNMQNLEELKKHLQQIETSIFVIHEKNDKICAYTNIKSGIVSVNVRQIKQYKSLNFPLDKTIPENKYEIGKIVASKIIYYLLHEIHGHKKYSFEKNNYNLSPQKFIKNGGILTLCQQNSEEEGDYFVKILPENKKGEGEDGYFYELIYGKIYDYYTFEIMDKLDDFSELISEVDLWVNKTQLLKKFIKYKYGLQYYKINYKSNKTNIEDKINDYKNKWLDFTKDKNLQIYEVFMKKRIKSNKNNKKSEEKKIKSYDINGNNNKRYESNKVKTNIIKANNIKNLKEPELFNENRENDIKIKEKEELNKAEENEDKKNKDIDEKIEEGKLEVHSENDIFIEINNEVKKKLFETIPYQYLFNLERTGLLTNKQIKIFRKRRREMTNYIRYSDIND